MKKLINMVLAMAVALILAITPTVIVTAAMAEELDYDRNEYSFEVHTDDTYPGYWQQTERMSYVMTFDPKPIKLVRYGKSAKLTADVTTAARVILIDYYDGRNWKRAGTYSNAPCKGSVVVSNDSQIKLIRATDNYSSWGHLKVVQNGKTLYNVRKYHAHDMNAAIALCINDSLVNQMRKQVKRTRTFNIPIKAEKYRIECIYTSLRGNNSYSNWIVVR